VLLISGVYKMQLFATNVSSASRYFAGALLSVSSLAPGADKCSGGGPPKASALGQDGSLAHKCQSSMVASISGSLTGHAVGCVSYALPCV